MNWREADLRTRLYMAAAAVLLIGLLSAFAIYLTADDNSENILIYEYEHSKMYRHNIERYTGKWGVLFSDFIGWFDSLWHGRALASTVAFISIFLAICIFYAGFNTLEDGENDEGSEDRPDKSG
jgi:hypothetical protein